MQALSLEAEALYFHLNQARHEERYTEKAPSGLAVASWTEHRLAGVRRDPAHDERCGMVVSKPFKLGGRRKGRQWFTVNAHSPPGDKTSELLYDLVVPRCKEEPRSFANFTRDRSHPLRGSHTATTLEWAGVGSDVTAARPAGRSHTTARLRFWLCGNVKLFAFTMWHGAARIPSPKSVSIYPKSLKPPEQPKPVRQLPTDSPKPYLEYPTHRGLCAPTVAPKVHWGNIPWTEASSGDCHAGDSGSFHTLLNQMSTLDDCVRACLGCARCNVVSASFTAPTWDCRLSLAGLVTD